MRRILTLVFCAWACAGLLLPQAAVQAAEIVLSDAPGAARNEMRYPALVAKWRRVQAGMNSDAQRLARCRADAEACSIEDRRLHDLIEAGRARDGRARLGEINRAINLAIRPVADERRFGVADHWSAPLQTMQAGAGDCEDYAILKLLVLRELGAADGDLRLIVVRDAVRGSNHAVAGVRAGASWVILDNRGFALVDLAQTRYRVILQLPPGADIETAALRDNGRRDGIM